jgi:hypothetical protein
MALLVSKESHLVTRCSHSQGLLSYAGHSPRQSFCPALLASVSHQSVGLLGMMARHTHGCSPLAGVLLSAPHTLLLPAAPHS